MSIERNPFDGNIAAYRLIAGGALQRVALHFDFQQCNLEQNQSYVWAKVESSSDVDVYIHD